jgi:tyrosyl-tRNA synthetase
MDLKKILAGEVTAALHGLDAAMKARAEFVAQFSRARFAGLDGLPTVNDIDRPVVEVVKSVGFAGSNGEVRRVAEQKGLRLVVEPASGGQEEVTLTVDDIRLPLRVVLEEKLKGADGDFYLRVGRKLARIIEPDE